MACAILRLPTAGSMRRPQASFEAQPRAARLLAPKMGIDPYELYVLSCCHVCTAQGLPLVTKGRLSFPKYILFPQPGVEICSCV